MRPQSAAEMVCRREPERRIKANCLASTMNLVLRKALVCLGTMGALVSILKSLHEGLVKPDLAQVEEGRISIDGSELSEAESRAMIQRMGL